MKIKNLEVSHETISADNPGLTVRLTRYYFNFENNEYCFYQLNNKKINILVMIYQRPEILQNHSVTTEVKMFNRLDKIMQLRAKLIKLSFKVKTSNDKAFISTLLKRIVDNLSGLTIDEVAKLNQIKNRSRIKLISGIV